MEPSEAARSWRELDILALNLIAVVVIFLLVLLQRNTVGSKISATRACRLPPGPRPWPIVGNFGELGSLLHQDFAKLAKKHGPILFLRLGSVRTIVISSPKLAEQVLKAHDSVFASRPANTNTRIMSCNGQNVSFAPYGPYWRHARKVLMLELFTARRMHSRQAMRTEEVLHTLHSILADCKDGTAAVCMMDKFGELACNIITRMVINKRFFSESGVGTTKLSRDRLGEYAQVFAESLKSFSAIVAGDYIPLLRGFDVGGSIRQMRKSQRRMDVILDKIIGEHEQRLNLSEGPARGRSEEDMDMVDILLTRPSGVDDDEKPLTRDQMKAILVDAFVAGTDTSSNTLAWVMAELLRNSHVLKRAQQELDEVVGRRRLVQESDIPQLPYLRAIVKEAFRLHPVTPLLLPHESLEDCEVGGYFIPAGARVFVNAWAIGRDDLVWDRALDFYPERFLSNEIDVVGQHFELLPFGSGRRSCPGRTLALLTVQYALAVHLHACNWCLPEGMKSEDIDLSEAPGLTTPLTTPLFLVATSRLPSSVLEPPQQSLSL